MCHVCGRDLTRPRGGRWHCRDGMAGVGGETMRTRIERKGGVLAAMLLLALALSALFVSTTFAASTTPAAGIQGRGGVAAAPSPPAAGTAGRGGVASAPYAPAAGTAGRGGAAVTYAAAGPAGSTISAGRSGAFVRTTPVAASTAARIIGGIAVTALVIALVAFLALGNRASRRGELAPVTSIVQAPSASPAAQYEDRERKAA